LRDACTQASGREKKLENQIICFSVQRYNGFTVGRLKMMKKKLYYAFRGKNFLEEAGIFYFFTVSFLKKIDLKK
jgi:hypothetical protein